MMRGVVVLDEQIGEAPKEVAVVNKFRSEQTVCVHGVTQSRTIMS